ncbi:hypothetical protein GJAV_G00200570 [Gymnothorax javanicus]|nr:hypothetical protein GJAV_G00200570 [Gymnothorax javanicus]
MKKSESATVWPKAGTEGFISCNTPSSHWSLRGTGEISVHCPFQEVKKKGRENLRYHLSVLPLMRSALNPIKDMKIYVILAVTLVSFAPSLVQGGDKKKLQIGVKKRVVQCAVKSRKGDVLHMHYTGKLEDGTEFDSSIPRNQPFTFTLGTGQVIKGWDQGLLGMCEGEKRKLVIPSELGYGDRGAPPKIPGGATLIFEVELLTIERKSEL